MTKSNEQQLAKICSDARSCQICVEHLPFEPRPVFQVGATARILLIGQAPGTRVHASGIPWDDPSGVRLRRWMNISDEQFYDENTLAIMPMGFCYPGKGKSGDLPPRPECAPAWHQKIKQFMPNIQCTLLIGQYAQKYYLADNYKTLTERVKNWQEYSPRIFVLPHPSPRNQIWLKKNPWFETQVVPKLQQNVTKII